MEERTIKCYHGLKVLRNFSADWRMVRCEMKAQIRLDVVG